MLKIYLLVEGNQRGIVQFAGDLIEHGADLRRQTGFAHQRHHVLTRLLMFIIFQNHPFLLRQIALGGNDRRDIDFARIERQPGQRPAHVQRFHRFELKTIDAFQPRQAQGAYRQLRRSADHQLRGDGLQVGEGAQMVFLRGLGTYRPGGDRGGRGRVQQSEIGRQDLSQLSADVLLAGGLGFAVIEIEQGAKIFRNDIDLTALQRRNNNFPVAEVETGVGFDMIFL